MTRDLERIWYIFTPAERYKAVCMLLLLLLMAAAETLGVLSIMPFLSVLGRPAIIQEHPLLQAAYDRLGLDDAREFIVVLGLASVAIVVASSAFKTVTQHLLNRFVHLQRHSISSRLLSRYLHQPYEFFLSRNTSELNKSILSETDQLMFNLIQPFAHMLAQGAVALAMVLLVFWYDPLMALGIVSAVGILYIAIYRLVRNRLARIGRERQAANGQRYQSSSEALGGIKDVKITHSAWAYQKKFDSASRTFSRHNAASETLAQTPLYIVEAVGFSGLILIALALLLRSNDIGHILPALGLYGFAAYRLLPAVQIVYRGFAKLRFSSSTLDAIHKDLSLPEESTPATSSMLAPQREIRLDHIRYAYPCAPDSPVFEDFTLVVSANSSIGISGRSGAGKSTLMDLLLGLLQPQAGTLKIDGTPVDGKNVKAWQRAIGYVPQHIYLADASVAENIAYGVPLNHIDMEAVERAARVAQIHDFVIGELSDGYGSVIGERGIRLSGGQRQRIGIARALYRDPPVLFFDEATSALDAETECAMNTAISKLSGRKTIVVIAHKDASLRACQKIVSLNRRS